jgi:hypothetical protein
MYQKLDISLILHEDEAQRLQDYVAWANAQPQLANDPANVTAVVHGILVAGLEDWSKEQRKRARHAAEDRCRELLPDATSADLWAFSWRVTEGVSEDVALAEVLATRRRDQEALTRNIQGIQPRLNINDQLRMKQEGLL